MAISFNASKVSECENEIIPGLPYDLALECLIRVPFTSHPSLRLVSHLWKSTISNPCFYSIRQTSNKAENLLFLIQPLSPTKTNTEATVAETFDNKKKASSGGDSSSGTTPPLLLYNLNIYNLSCQKWTPLLGISTIPTFAQLVVLPTLRKLLLLGGWDPSTLEPVSRVVLIDLARGTWSDASPMPTPRSFFACAAVGPATVYVAGGHDARKNALRSADLYDVLSDQWHSLPPMSQERDECHALSFDDKFWVVSGYGTESQGRFRPDAEIFDPEKRAWITVNGLWPYPANSPKSTAVVKVDGRSRWWHVLGGQIMDYQWQENQWKGVNMGRLPEWVTGLLSSSSSVCLVDMGDGKIFVMGNAENTCGAQQRVLMLERVTQDNVKTGINWRCQHLFTSPTFFGFPFSTSHLRI
ncbi:F-box/kelch-repeat protein SKIP20 [Bienertia sinuspersici]